MVQFYWPSLWRSDKGVGYIDEVALRRARLVLGWVTADRVQILVTKNLSWSNQPPRSTQPGHPSVGGRK